MKCQICDYDVREIWRRARRAYDGAWFQGLPNPYPGPFPRGDGRGRVVLFWPRRAPELLNEFSAVGAESCIRGFEIITCGEDVCVFRAHHHGVPGWDYGDSAP